VLIVVGDGASATVVEDFRDTGDGPGWTNAVTEVVLGAGARIEHVGVLGRAPAAFHTGTVYVRQARASRFAGRVFALGARLARRDTRVLFAEAGADCTLDGLYVVGGEEHVDCHTAVDHARPSGTSRELYKGVLDGAARAVFNGAILIRPDAQKSDAGQDNRNLLLSEDATIDTKPELQIWADDVKCSHGATVGQLDDDALFYLRARGIDLAAARSLLVHAFAREIVERVGHPGLRADLDDLVRDRMAALSGGGKEAP
jgi:Fe-S cluster assembly protein SufD